MRLLTGARVRSGSISDFAASFDHLVGALQECARDCQAECFCGLEIYDQLEFDWGLDGELAGLFTLENAIDIDRGTPKIIGLFNSVG